MSNYQELYEKWLNSSALTEEEKLQLKNISFVADIFIYSISGNLSIILFFRILIITLR